MKGSVLSGQQMRMDASALQMGCGQRPQIHYFARKATAKKNILQDSETRAEDFELWLDPAAEM